MSNKYFNRENKPFIHKDEIDSSKIEELFSSVQNMNTQEIENVVNRVQIPINLTNKFGNNLIHETLLNEEYQKSELNRLNLIKFLINNNVNPNSPNRENITPLHLACKYQYREIIKYLLEIGVNPNFKDSFGNTPFHYYLNGRILTYYDRNIYNLVPPVEVKKDLLNYSEEEIGKNRDLYINIWNKIKDSSGVKVISSTIKKDVMLQQEIKNILLSFPKDLNLTNNQTKFDATLNSIDELIRKTGWSNFAKIENIRLDTKNNNSWPNTSESEMSIIHDLKNGKIHDQLSEEVKSSINIIKEICDNKESFFVKEKMDITFFRDFFKLPPDLEINNMGLNQQVYYDYINTIYERNIPDLCVDAADNCIDVDTKLFIGGTRQIDFIEEKEILIAKDITKNFNKYEGLLECPDTSQYVREKILYQFQLSNKDKNLLDYNKEIFTNNQKKSGLNEFHRMYHLFLNQVDLQDYTKLNPKIYLSNLYLFAGYLNLSRGGDMELSMSQAFKTFLIEGTKYKLNVWVKYLFSNNSLENIDEEVSINLQMLVNCVENLVNGDQIQNTSDLERYTGVNYTNHYEWVIYGLTKYYNNMKQKPVFIHVIDTLFIIRKLLDIKNNKKVTVIEKYLKQMDFHNLKIENFYNNKIAENNDGLLEILPSRKFFYFGYNKLNEDEKPYYIKKFIESYALGLSFLDCFPNKSQNRFLTPTGSLNKELTEVEIEINTNKEIEITEFNNNVNKLNFTPYMGYLKANKNLKNEVNNAINNNSNGPHGLKRVNYNISKNLFIYDNIFRPSSKEGLICVINNLRVNLNIEFSNILNRKNFCERLQKTIRDDKSDSFFKIFPEIYPEILNINSMKKQVIKEVIFSPDFKENYNMQQKINLIVTNLNRINAYYFINFYLHTKGDNLYIPSFYYYKIPAPDSSEKSLIFYEKESNFDDNYENNPIANSAEVNVNNLENINNLISNKNKKGYGTPDLYIPVFIEDILNNNKYISSNTINKNMKLSKDSIIPPSLEGFLYDFYKYVVLDIIINNLPQVSDKVDELIDFSTDEKMKKDIILHQTAVYIEEILGDYFKNEIKGISLKLLDKINNNTKSKIFSPIQDFTDYIKKKENFYNYVDIDKVLNDDYFKIGEKIKKKDDFLIIPNDYTNNELLKQLNKIIIDKEILTILLNKNCKPFIVNKENRSAVYSVLRNYYYPIFQNLNDKNLMYQQFYQDSLIYGIEQPLNYIKNEFENHLQKLLFNEMKIDDIFRKFTFNQYQEINLLIKTNDNFGNNELKNLESSYLIISYLINGYLLESLFDGNLNILTLNDFFNILKIDKKDKFTEFFKINKKITLDNNYWFVLEKIEEINEELNKYKNKINEIKSFNEQNKLLTIGFNRISLTNLNIEKDMLDLKKKLKDLKERERFYSKSKNANTDVKMSKRLTEKFDTLIEKNGFNRNSYIETFKDFLNSDDSISNDRNLFIIKACQILLEKIKNFNVNTASIGDLNNMKENLKSITDVFGHLENKALLYFKHQKYSDSNQFSKYMKEILIHMTQNIICYRFEVAIRKVIFNYYDRKNMDANDILNIIDLVFSDNIILKNKGNNTMIKILYNELAESLVMNSANPIFKNKGEEVNYLRQSTYEIFSDYINLLKSSSLRIESDSEIMNDFDYVIRYFDEISSKIIYNWQVTMENYLKFAVNQSRILKVFFSMR